MKTKKRQNFIAAARSLALTGVFTAMAPAHENAAQPAVEQSAYATAVESYIRFLPRYYTFGLEKLMTAVPEPLSRPAAPLNQVGYRRSLVTPDLLFIVRPNNDTIYGAGYLDPSAEPIIVRVPEAGKRFWSIQLADPWTNIAPGIGSRSGSKPGLYAIVGPKWSGKLPDGATEVRLGEGHHNIALRVGYSSFADQAETDADLKKAVETLHGFVVLPLSKFTQGSVPDRAQDSKDAPQPPTSLRAVTAGLAERRPLTLLALILEAVKDPGTPLDDGDRALLARFDKDLTKALTEFESSQADQATAAAMTRGVHDARALIDERVRTSKRGDNGWVTIKAGEWGNKYLDRAAIAEYAIYANRAASSMYPETHVDDIGDPLDGSKRYTLRFEKGQLPPVTDFWSITMYRGDTLTLADNPIKRYSIGDRTPGLKFAEDGSLTIYIQKDSPGKDKESNWLPSPAGEFNLMCRAYGPEQVLLDGKYTMPPVKRVESSARWIRMNHETRDLNHDSHRKDMMMKRSRALFAALGLLVAPLAPTVLAQEVLPRPDQPFKGKIGRTGADSTPDFPKPIEAPKGAPNILLILTDDVGFGASSTFGGPIPTPTMDRLGKNGLRYNQFHTTALCSPTRAALLSGRNHHSANTGVIMELGTGFPGYNSLMSKGNGTFAEILKQNGYNTSWYGKNHNVPDWQTSQAGPFDLWPTGLGFEYFYGFIGGDTSQWNPALFENTKPIEPPHDAKDYFFDKDMADHCIDWIRMQHATAPGKPFLAYYAPGTAHAPHHAPKDWIAKFKGKFDQGWDKVREETFARQKTAGIIPANAKLTERPDSIPAWDSLNADQKKVFARMMEVYAAALSHCDHQMGRILDAIEAQGELDNTLVIYIQGDNGASAEGGMQGLLNEMTVFNAIPEDMKEVIRRMDELGGPTTFNHYPVGWAHAMDTPFQWTKQIASHFGGTRNGLVISWPARIKDKGGIRTQFCSVIDIAPTILEAVGVPAPASINGVAQKPIEGTSLIYSFDDAKAPSKHTTQYFEMFGNRAIYHDGWVAATTPGVAPWDSAAEVQGRLPAVLDYKWELYNVAEDFPEANDLAAKEPAKLKELQDLFWVEAQKYNVLPINNSRIDRFDVNLRPSLTKGREEFTYYPGLVRIPEGAAPDTKNKSYQIKAEVDIPAGGAEGMLLTHGGRFSGWGLYVLKGKPVFHYNLAGVARYNIAGNDALTPGKHTILFDFKYDGGGLGKGGTGTLQVDGKTVATGRVERTLPFRLSLDETLDCGEDTGTPVSEDYHVPFKFTGEIGKVVIDLTPEKLTAADRQRLKQGKIAIAASE